MKIKNIDSIRNYGIFTDYTKGNTKDFGQTNIFFGWNYSGKTTLSRIFRSLELKIPHPDYQSGKFRIQTESGRTITEEDIDNQRLRIRVFNSDYVKANLKWDDTKKGFPPILLLGTKAKLKERLDAVVKEKESLSSMKNGIEELREKNKHSFDIALTGKAREIRTVLELRTNFDRRNLLRLLESEQIGSWLLEEEKVEGLLQISRRIDKLEPVQEIVLEVQENIIEKTLQVLKKTVAPSQTIQRLKDDMETENWVRRGRDLHQNKTVCEFCQAVLPEYLLNELDQHFSKEYEAFRQEVKAQGTWLEEQKLKNKVRSINKVEFYKELQQEFEQRYKNLQDKIDKHDNVLDQLIELVNQKERKLGEKMVIDEALDLDIPEIREAVLSINLLVKTHQQKTKNFDKAKENATECLKKHYASKAYRDLKVKEVRKRDVKLAQETIDLDSKITELEEEINKLEPQISESSAGANKLNFFIKLYFGKTSPIEIRVVDERFILYRGEFPSKNLSEGEQTAISFAYFLTCLEDKDTEEFLEQTIVFIDDPISSLDENHIYNSYAIIKTYVKGKCGQLFISTHNYQFFTLCKQLISKPDFRRCDKFSQRQYDTCLISLYQLNRKQDSTTITNLDCLLCKFSSEYQYIFYKIHQMLFEIDDLEDDEYTLYLMPNLLRRFLETYCGFYFPHKKLREALRSIISIPHEIEIVNRIINDFSHSQDASRIFRLFTTEEIKEAAAIIFTAFSKSEVTKQHLNELLNSIGAEKTLDELMNVLEQYITKPLPKHKKEISKSNGRGTGQLTLF